MALAACSPTTDLPLGSAAAARFHQQLNAGQFDAIYAASASAFKAVTTDAAFRQILAALHRKLGVFKTGTVQGWNDNVTFGGHVLTLRMQSQYDKGPAAETFIFALGDGRAALVSYNVNSALLITS